MLHGTIARRRHSTSPLMLAQAMLAAPLNPNGRPNSDVVRPVASAIDLRARVAGQVDHRLRLDVAGRGRAVRDAVRVRATSTCSRCVHKRRSDFRGQWWQYARPRPEMRAALNGQERYIVTPEVSKHRIFVWMRPDSAVQPADLSLRPRRRLLLRRPALPRPRALGASAWARNCARPRAASATPPPPPSRPSPSPGRPARSRRTTHASRPSPQAARSWWRSATPGSTRPAQSDAERKKRTLTNLYNQRPTWLDLAHRKLDEAVLDAYGWPSRPDRRGNPGAAAGAEPRNGREYRQADPAELSYPRCSVGPL